MLQRLILSVLVIASMPLGSAVAATLQVTVHGVRNDRGHIRIGVCRRQEFLSEVCERHVVVPARAGDVTAVIPGIEPGVYGVAAYQDEDDSGRLKRNFFGLPKEDLGFSRDPALRFGPPSFDVSAIRIGSDGGQVTLVLHHFGS